MKSFDPEDAVPVLAGVVAVTALVLGAGVAVSLATPGSVLDTGGEVDEASHANPGSSGDAPDLAAVERYLSTRLVSGVQIDAESLSPGQINRTRAIINSTRYGTLLSQYSEVADGRGTADRASVYRDLRANQRAFVIAIDDYWQTHERYRTARDLEADGSDPVENGPVPDVEDPTRYLAHRLEANWSRVLRTYTALVPSYRRAMSATDRDFRDSIVSANVTRNDLRDAQEPVRDRELVVTETIASANRSFASFDAPLGITGRVTTDDGTAVANTTVRVLVPNRTVETRTGPDGRFELTYRPTLVSANATEIVVETVPETDTRYARSSWRIGVEIRHHTPAVGVRARPDGVRFAEALRVTGNVGPNGTAAPGIPYVVTVDGTVLAHRTTGPGGRIDASAPLPADASVGDRPVRVATLLKGRALAPATGRTTVRVNESEARLTAAVEDTRGETLRVSGRLASESGDPVAEQRIDLAVDGTRVGTTLTGADGRYETNVVVPAGTVGSGPLAALRSEGEQVNVTASYDDPGTNLGAATASTTATVYPGLSLAFVAGVTILALVALGAVYWLVRRRQSGRPEPDDAPFGPAGSESVSLFAGDDGSGPDGEIGTDPDSLFSYASEQLAAGRPAAAVRAGYVGARRGVEARLGTRIPGTHWEFYRECRDGALDEAEIEALQAVTEGYERAAFAPESIESDTAADYLDRMRRLAGRDGEGEAVTRSADD